MRCPNCGYFNLPGADRCGQCGQSLAAPAAAPAAFEEIYPPRARTRTVRERMEARAGRPARAARRGLAAADERRRAAWAIARQRASQSAANIPSRAQVMADMRYWGLASAAVIPGVGHFLLGNSRRGLAFLGIGAVLLAGALFIPLAVANLLGWMLAGLMCVSVYETAREVFPGGQTTGSAGELRTIRLGLMSVMIVFATVATVIWMASLAFTPVTMANESELPALHAGDSLLLRPLGPSPRARRGEIVLADLGPATDAFLNGDEEVDLQNLPVVERVLGIAGDRVALQSGQLWVNGVPLSHARLPLAFAVSAGAGDFQVAVPAGSVCLWRPRITFERDGVPLPWRTPTGNPLVVVPETSIQGQAVAVFDPPQDRRWLR